MKNESRFYETLEDIFVGAPIEGEGGYVNLLKVKEKYYREVLDEFKNEISGDEIITEEYKEDFYGMLYTFFEKYFSECGSVYFAKTANWQRVYEKVYTDNKDVALFWKTHMLYYVKTDMLFKSTYITVADSEDTKFVFYFDVADLQNKQNNEKNELIFTYKEVKDGKVEGVHTENCGDRTFVIAVAYKTGRATTGIKNIADACGVSEEIITKAIKLFKKQTSVDFFINKNAKSFLEEQLMLFLNQYLIDDESQFSQKRLNQLKALKKYATKIIAFISQFEDELVRIWNKPKFVLNSNYVISIDKLDKDLIKKIAKHKGLQEQIQEWKDLYFVEDNFKFTQAQLKDNQHLPIDTKYFKDLELEILAQFENLDEELNGRLIKSENYQALNTLKDRYKNQVQCVYIDPPFNTGNDFVFLDVFQDSTWLSLMNDRLKFAKELLRHDGSIYVELDHIAEHYGKIILDNTFGVGNYVGKITWNTGDNISGFKSQAKYWIRQADYIHFYTNREQFNKDNGYKFTKIYELTQEEKNKEMQPSDYGWLDFLSKENKKYYIERWEGGKLVQKEVQGLKLKAKGTIWNDIYSFQYSEPRITESIAFISNQKPENLLRRIIQSSTDQRDLVCDFFMGSGTSIAVSHKLNRKWLGIEMGDYFYNTYEDVASFEKTEKKESKVVEDNENIKDLNKNLNKKAILETLHETKQSVTYRLRKLGVLGRMKNVLKGDKEFSSISSAVLRKPHLSKDVNWQGGGFFKYYELEQYEDVLKRVKYSQDKGNVYEKGSKIFDQYVFFADQKYADVLDVANGVMEIDFSKLYKNIDFPETLSLLYGKPIEKITAETVKLAGVSEPIKYNVETMSDKEKIDFLKKLKPLLWWGK